MISTPTQSESSERNGFIKDIRRAGVASAVIGGVGILVLVLSLFVSQASLAHDVLYFSIKILFSLVYLSFVFVGYSIGRTTETNLSKKVFSLLRLAVVLVAILGVYTISVNRGVGLVVIFCFAFIMKGYVAAIKLDLHK